MEDLLPKSKAANTSTDTPNSKPEPAPEAPEATPDAVDEKTRVTPAENLTANEPESEPALLDTSDVAPNVYDSDMEDLLPKSKAANTSIDTPGSKPVPVPEAPEATPNAVDEKTLATPAEGATEGTAELRASFARHQRGCTRNAS